MRVVQAPWSSTLTLLLGASLARAQYLINELSFGYSGSIAPNGGVVIPGFSLQGAPNIPEILSNKIVLTPVAPGNQRGAVWSDKKLMHTTWITDLDFRVNGPERGGGNINIWLTNGGSSDIGTNSVYTVGRFDGLVLVVDMHGGSGGMVRGFLNDRTTDYKAQSDISGLAFGHCLYRYRNLGRPSQIKMRQTEKSFKVEVDGTLCFESDKITVPPGYQYGITAASADNPDSFEVFKLVVMSESLVPDNTYTQVTPDDNQAAMKDERKPTEGQSPPNTYGKAGFATSDKIPDDPFDSSIPDQTPDTFTSSKSQFADLHNRLQSVNHHVSTIFRAVSKHSQMNEQRHMEISQMLNDVKQELRRLDAITDLSSKIQNLEKEMRLLRSDVNLQVKNSEHSLKGFLSEHHATLSSSIVNAAPGHGKLIAVIVGSQVVVAAAYYLYKRRRNSMPKKYL